MTRFGAFPTRRGERLAISCTLFNLASNRLTGDRCLRSGQGVIEIRLHGETEYRVFYIAAFPEAVYVLHAFEKKTRKTSQRDLETGRENLKELRRWRRKEGL